MGKSDYHLSIFHAVKRKLNFKIFWKFKREMKKARRHLPPRSDPSVMMGWETFDRNGAANEGKGVAQNSVQTPRCVNERRTVHGAALHTLNGTMPASICSRTSVARKNDACMATFLPPSFASAVDGCHTRTSSHKPGQFIGRNCALSSVALYHLCFSPASSRSLLSHFLWWSRLKLSKRLTGV